MLEHTDIISCSDISRHKNSGHGKSYVWIKGPSQYLNIWELGTMCKDTTHKYKIEACTYGCYVIKVNLYGTSGSFVSKRKYSSDQSSGGGGVIE